MEGQNWPRETWNMLHSASVVFNDISIIVSVKNRWPMAFQYLRSWWVTHEVFMAKVASPDMKRGFKAVMILPWWQSKIPVTVLRKDNDNEMLHFCVNIILLKSCQEDLVQTQTLTFASCHWNAALMEKFPAGKGMTPTRPNRIWAYADCTENPYETIRMWVTDNPPL